MTTPVRVAGFVLGVLAVFAAAMGVGYAVGPLDVEPVEESHDGMAAAPHGDEPEGHGDEPEGHGGHAAETVGLPGGLAVSEAGYTLHLGSGTTEPGAGVRLDLVIEGPDGHPVTEFDVEHEKQLHLIAVRRDQTGFQHVHPTMAADGTWTTDLDLTAGAWRVFADFTPTGGEGLTLGADLSVAGDYEPQAPMPETTTATVGDYTVSIEGELVAGAASPVTLTVTRDGEPVTDLQPYLGAHGHLVALRVGDLAYLHVHPEDTGEAGPEVPFVVEVPTAGDYRLYLDFRHDGVVRTAELAVTAHPEGAHDDH